MNLSAALTFSGPVRTIAARAASILASFLLTLFVARTLPVASSGTFFVIFALLAVAATIARFGTDNLAMKFSGGTTQAIRAVVAQLWIIAGTAGIATTLVVGAVLCIGDAVWAGGLPLDGFDASVGMVAAAAILPQAFSVLAGALLRGQGRLALGTVAELGSMPALTVIVIAAMTFIGPISLLAAIWALTISSWVSAVWSVIVANRVVPVIPTQDANAHASAWVWLGGFASLATFFRHHGRSLAAMMGTSLLFYIVISAPIFVLTVTNGPQDVSYYTVTARLAAFITLVPTIQVSYLAPAFSRLLHNGQLRELNTLCRRSALHAALVSAIPSLLLGVWAPQILALLYGPEFVSASVALMLLVMGNFIVVLAGQVNQLMLLSGFEHAAFALNAALLLVWACAGVALELWSGGLNAAAGVFIGVSIIYSVIAASLLARRGIRSYV